MDSRTPRIETVFDTIEWRRGDLAYYFPAFSGPVPCRVMGRIGHRAVLVRITASRPGYSRSEYCTAGLSADGVSGELYARNAVHTDRGRYYADNHRHDLSGLPEYVRFGPGFHERMTTNY